MAVRRLADEQPADFTFTPENLEWAKKRIADYPEGRQASAVIPILWRAQEQHHGWLPEPAIRLVADMLEMPYIRVLEVATFYTMFQLKPVGTVAHVNVCGTTPCMLRGAEELIAICKKRIAAHAFDLSADGRFSWEEVECAGACVNAPMVQIGAETYEDLTPDTFNALLDTLAAGGRPRPGPQSARRGSEPLSGITSLTTPADTSDRHESADDHLGTAKTADEDPTTPAARHEDAASPNGQDRAEVEAARSEAPAGGATGTEEPPAEAEEAGTGGGETAPPQAKPASASSAPAAAEPAAPEPVATAPAEPVRAGESQEAQEAQEAQEVDENANLDSAAVSRADGAGVRPPVLTSAQAGEPDDLQKISGIGRVLEKRLHQLGIFKYAQIAAWDQSHKDWVSSYLTFKGRIDRERWVEQAQALMDGNQGDAS